MRLPIITTALAAALLPHNVQGRRTPSHIPVTNNTIQLRTTTCGPEHLPPSSQYLAHRRLSSLHAKRQVNAGPVQNSLLTIGGRLYLADVAIGNQPFRLVIDTGSSDTWVASSTFQCVNPNTNVVIDVRYCGFGQTYDRRRSTTWNKILSYPFNVGYAGGEFLRGDLGTEMLGFGDAGGRLVVNQTIGVVETGYWVGDGASAGLMGLAYPALVSGARELGYDSVMTTLTNAAPTPQLFALALRRTTASNPYAGGILAIGGIPNVPVDGPFVTLPIQPTVRDVFAYYKVNMDAFDITPPVTLSNPVNPNDPTAGRHRIRYEISTTVDSGTSLLYLPDQITDYIASLFVPRAQMNPQTGVYIVKCDAVAPRVGIVLGGTTFFIHEDDLLNRGPGAVGGPSYGAAPGYCVLGAQRAGAGGVVLGDTWMKGVLVVFDLGQSEIRVASRLNY